jgi:glycosyltransferase involved in cell wall biosynthesis
VSPKKPEELAEAVMRLLDNPEWAQKLGKNLYRSLKKKYSLSNMVHKIQDLYIELYQQIRRSQK